jgi:hypothetical protein
MSKNKKEVVGTKYFLILFAKFGPNNKLLTDILSQFSQIMTSSYLKFQEGDDFVIVHFETDETLKNTREFCRLVLDDTVRDYVLFPNNKNVYLSLPDDRKEHLLDLEMETFDCEDDIDNPIDFNLDYDEEDDILSEIYKKNGKKHPLEHLLTALNNQQEKQPSLDELLDKIQNNGLESLTKKEKELLYDYSKGI